MKPFSCNAAIEHCTLLTASYNPSDGDTWKMVDHCCTHTTITSTSACGNVVMVISEGVDATFHSPLELCCDSSPQSNPNRTYTSTPPITFFVLLKTASRPWGCKFFHLHNPCDLNKMSAAPAKGCRRCSSRQSLSSLFPPSWATIPLPRIVSGVLAVNPWSGPP